MTANITFTHISVNFLHSILDHIPIVKLIVYKITDFIYILTIGLTTSITNSIF